MVVVVVVFVVVVVSMTNMMHVMNMNLITNLHMITQMHKPFMMLLKIPGQSVGTGSDLSFWPVYVQPKSPNHSPGTI